VITGERSSNGRRAGADQPVGRPRLPAVHGRGCRAPAQVAGLGGRLVVDQLLLAHELDVGRRVLDRARPLAFAGEEVPQFEAEVVRRDEGAVRLLDAPLRAQGPLGGQRLRLGGRVLARRLVGSVPGNERRRGGASENPRQPGGRRAGTPGPGRRRRGLRAPGAGAGGLRSRTAPRAPPRRHCRPGHRRGAGRRARPVGASPATPSARPSSWRLQSDGRSRFSGGWSPARCASGARGRRTGRRRRPGRRGCRAR
jgi:hypothetical protein